MGATILGSLREQVQLGQMSRVSRDSRKLIFLWLEFLSLTSVTSELPPGAILGMVPLCKIQEHVLLIFN